MQFCSFTNVRKNPKYFPSPGSQSILVRPKQLPKFAIWRTYALPAWVADFLKHTRVIYKHEKSCIYTDLSADPWRGGTSSISPAGSERDVEQSRVRLAPSEKRRREPARSAQSGGGAEERNLGFPSRREQPINPKSKVKSGGTEGSKIPRCK